MGAHLTRALQIQKFFEHGTPEHKRRLADAIKGRVVDFALQM